MFAMFCMARHCEPYYSASAKIENRPVGIWPDDEVFAAATAKLVRNNRRWSETG